MAKLVDALASGASTFTGMGVRISLSAQTDKNVGFTAVKRILRQ